MVNYYAIMTKPFLLSLRGAATTKQSRFYKDKIRLPRSLRSLAMTS